MLWTIPAIATSSCRITGASFKTITIDHTKVPNTDLTNFPLLINGTYSYLKSVSNGGSVQNVNGYDIGFYSDSSLTTKLKWEKVYWDATTGTVEYWVKIPSLSHTVDTVIYMGYGNTSITTDQSDVVNTWNTNYLAVYHLKDGTTLDFTNSITAAAATNNGTTVTSGKIDGGAAFSGSSQYINLGNNFGSIYNSDFTVQAWVNPTDFSGFNGVVSKTASNQPKPFDFYLVTGTGIPRMFIGDGSSGTNVDASSAPSTGVWSKLTAVKTGTITITHYLNGSPNGSGNAAGAPNPLANGSDNMYIGTRSDFVTMFKGSMDEVRILQAALTADWEAAEYNNQSSPSTFYSIT